MARLETVYKEKILPALVEQFMLINLLCRPRASQNNAQYGCCGAVADKKVLTIAL